MLYVYPPVCLNTHTDAHLPFFYSNQNRWYDNAQHVKKVMKRLLPSNQANRVNRVNQTAAVQRHPHVVPHAVPHPLAYEVAIMPPLGMTCRLMPMGTVPSTPVYKLPKRKWAGGSKSCVIVRNASKMRRRSVRDLNQDHAHRRRRRRKRRNVSV